ncbi:MAG: alpha/beta fold hydrolase, partial [Thermoplasmata archaeon]
MEDAARRGLRLIGYDRPGYGSSAPMRGRRVADAALDVLAIANHLNLDRFAIWGHSGGGPHALACAAILP